MFCLVLQRGCSWVVCVIDLLCLLTLVEFIGFLGW